MTLDRDLLNELGKRMKTFSTRDPNIVLTKEGDPLSAKDTYSGKAVYKYSFHPKTHEILYSHTGEHHSDAIQRAGKSSKFDEYVRIIFDYKNNVIGTRPWGLDDISPNSEKILKKSYDVQYVAYQYFKTRHSGLKWVPNITNADLTYGLEMLESKKLPSERIVDGTKLN